MDRCLACGGPRSWRERRYTRVLRRFIVVAVIVGVGAVHAGAAAVSDVVQETLLEALSRGDVNARFAATGWIGAALDMTVTSNVDTSLAVSLDPGLLLGCGIAGVQRFVVRSPSEFSVLSDRPETRFVVLDPRETLTVGLDAYCLDESEDLPAQGTAYWVEGMASIKVQRVLGASLASVGGQDPTVCVVQAAVWIAEDGVSRGRFESRMDGCTDVNAAEVVALCERAGFAAGSSWRGTSSSTESTSSYFDEPEGEILVWILIGFGLLLLGLLESL